MVFYYTCGTFFKNERAGKRNHDDENEKDDEDEKEDHEKEQPLMRLSVSLQAICLCSNESATSRRRHRQRRRGFAFRDAVSYFFFTTLDVFQGTLLFLSYYSDDARPDGIGE